MGGSQSQSRASSAASTRSRSSKGCLSFPFHSNPAIKCDITLAFLGLDNAGKTSTVLALAKESDEDLAPTVGFSSKTISVHGQHVTLYDLGGGPNIRGIWKEYLAEVHGVVFIVDAADPSRIDEASREFNSVCSNPHIAGKPILILANKSDKEEALSEYELTDKMKLEDTVNEHMTPTKVQASTVMSKDHATLKEGMKWLYMAIASDWSSLSSRVTEETRLLKEKKQAERKERLARIRREKEEREALEGEENGGDDDDENMAGDPFQSLDDHLKVKAKEDAKKKSPRRGKKASKAAEMHKNSDGQRVVDHNENNAESLDVSNPAGGKVQASPTGSDTESRRNLFAASGESAFRAPVSTSQTVQRAPSPRPAPFGESLGSLPARLPPLGGALPPLNGATPLKPLESFHSDLLTKKKKRKKKARINPGGDEGGETPSHDSNGLLPVEEEPS